MRGVFDVVRDLFSASKTDNQADCRNCEMQVIVGIIDREESEDVAAHHESEDRDGAVDQSEEDEERSGRGLTRVEREEGDQTTCEVNDIVDGVHFEHQEHAGGEETGDAYDRQHQTENAGERLHEKVHGRRREKDRLGKILPHMRAWQIGGASAVPDVLRRPAAASQAF